LAIVETIPPSVSKVDGFKSGGNITDDGGTSIIQRGICWAEHAGPTIQDSITKDGTGTGYFASIFYGFKDNTTYYVRAYAINSRGVAYGNEESTTTLPSDMVVDVDNNIYTFSQFNTIDLLLQNLKTTRYANGDPIINGLTGFNWATLTEGAYTFPGEDTGNKEAHGLYYNLAAVNDSRGMCPAGWRIATDEDWKVIERLEGVSDGEVDNIGYRYIYPFFKEYLSSSGYFLNNNATYNYLGNAGFYWSSTKVSDSGNWIRSFNDANSPYYSMYRNIISDTSGSVRCVRDHVE